MTTTTLPTGLKMFDPHVHMTSRTTDDYERMAAAGVVAVLEPAFWLGQPRTQLGTFLDYFSALIGWERFRASQFGIVHVCTLALNPKEANDDRVSGPVLEALPRFLEKDGVVGVGEVGYDDVTAREEKVFAAQVEIAKKARLPVLVHTPHRDKKRGTERSLALIRESGIDEAMVLIDHNNEETLPLVRETGCWAGHSIYPDTKMTEERVVALMQRFGTDKIIVNSAADWGKSDPLKVPKTAAAMAAAGFAAAEIEKVVWSNPVAFFAQSGKLDLSSLDARGVDQRLLFEGNSVLRGQAPAVTTPAAKRG
ncbi:MAG TPA: TatD family hydrolase [Polyangia bacterium]|jgi:predicted metal-dependent TIM-barrel fold hydrolase|nr:TatD family hydrolase [Polyangia bacterium]